MRVLITGATGFVGTNLCAALAEQGHGLVALSRDPDAARRSLPLLRAAYAWEPLAGPPPAAALANVDAVVHLAGEPVVGRWTATKKKAIRDSRVLGTRNLVRAMIPAEAAPATLVSASAIGFYGDRGDETLTEASAAGDGFLARTCQEWEAEAQRAAQSGIRTVSLRIGVVLARGGGALQAMLPPFKMGIGGPLGSGRQWWSWVHRDDLVGMIQFALAHSEVRGTYNATAPNPARQKEFGKVLGKVLRRPAFIPTPALALKVVLGGFATELLSSKRVLPQRMQAAGYEMQRPDLEAALRQALA